MLPKITIPEKIIVTGGLPRSGKTMIRDILGSHSQIAHVPSAFSFFHWFSEDKYKERGGFDENLDFFSNTAGKAILGRLPKKWWDILVKTVEISI